MDSYNNPYIPFVEKFTLTDEFRYLAKTFEEKGVYCLFNEESQDYIDFWKDVKNKCLNGMTNSAGITIPGTYFFYLNFCPILSQSEDEVNKRKRKTFNFPRFVDLDYEYFSMVEYCKQNEKSLIAVKGRRQGWSYKGASVATHEYTFYKESKSIIGAFLGAYSQGTMNMVIGYLNHISTHTPFGHIRNPDLKDYFMSQYQKDINGVKVWHGYKSSIEAITFKDRPAVAAGKSASILLLDEAGLFPNITESWGFTEPLIKDGSSYTGIALIYGSSGDMDTGSKFFYEMFTNPTKYNMLEFSDPENPSKKIGFFSSATKGRWGICKDPKSKWYKQPMVDKDGNSNELAAYDDIMYAREAVKGGLDPRAIHLTTTQYPVTWQEAFLRNKGAIFASPEMLEWLGKLETTPSLRDETQKGELIWVDGKLEFRPKDTLNYITSFPLKPDEDNTGCIAIWERPEMINSEIPFGLYIAGCLTPGEKVLTNKGLQNIEEVKLEDKLINEEGKFVDIINLQRYDVKDEDIFKIKMANTFRTTTFTKEHPLLVSKPNYKVNYKLNHPKYKFNEGYWDFDFKYIKTDKVEIGDWIKVPNIYNKYGNKDISNYWNNDNYRIDRQIDNPLNKDDFWWFIGLWLGDGWCEKDSHIAISFNTKDQYYINKTKDIIKNIFKRTYHEEVDINCTCISFCFAQLNDFLNEHFGKYSHGKKIPEWVKYNNIPIKHNLILGYLASDGCITKHTFGYNSMEFVSINLELLESIQDIGFSLGLISNLSKLRNESVVLFRNKESKTKECYHLRFGHSDTIKFGKYFNISNDTKLNLIDYNKQTRKKQKSDCFFSKDLEYIYFKIKDIEKSKYTGIVYNFECDTHTFMCHHITTHNCDPYDMDKSGTNSLGSFYIYKRFLRAGSTHDIIVAEYTGRPKSADEFYENCRRLCIYYNAKVLYENQLKGFKGYFEQKNCLHYLWEQPQIIKDIVKNSKVQRGYGIHMNRGSNGSSGIKDTCELYLKDWLYTELKTDNGEFKFNFHNIKSIALLKELIAYDIEGNYDRCIALMLCILQTKELHKLHIEQMTNTSSSIGNQPFMLKLWERRNIKQDKFKIYTK